jgi:hypothetical protein
VRAHEYPGLSVQKTLSKPAHAPTEITSVFRLRLRLSVADFTFAARHGLTTSSLVAGALNSAVTCLRHLHGEEVRSLLHCRCLIGLPRRAPSLDAQAVKRVLALATSNKRGLGARPSIHSTSTVLLAVAAHGRPHLKVNI